MEKTDRILPLTRWVGALVIPFLWIAFVILYFFPESTGQHFAWPIKPHMMAMYIGAGYLGGSWLFVNAVRGKRWHRLQIGFLPITVFTAIMLIATIVYWDRFTHGSLAFYAWFILYLVTPLLVPAVWFYNRRTDPKTPEEVDFVFPSLVQWGLRIGALFFLIFIIIGIFNPGFMMRIWPWKLTPLTSLVMSGWLSLLGVGTLALSFESRWSGWKIPGGSILIWHLLVLIAIFLNPADFSNGVVNWFTVAVAALVVGILALFLVMGRVVKRH